MITIIFHFKYLDNNIKGKKASGVVPTAEAERGTRCDSPCVIWWPAAGGPQRAALSLWEGPSAHERTTARTHKAGRCAEQKRMPVNPHHRNNGGGTSS